MTTPIIEPDQPVDPSDPSPGEPDVVPSLDPEPAVPVEPLPETEPEIPE